MLLCLQCDLCCAAASNLKHLHQQADTLQEGCWSRLCFVDCCNGTAI